MNVDSSSASSKTRRKKLKNPPGLVLGLLWIFRDLPWPFVTFLEHSLGLFHYFSYFVVSYMIFLRLSGLFGWLFQTFWDFCDFWGLLRLFLTLGTFSDCFGPVQRLFEVNTSSAHTGSSYHSPNHISWIKLVQIDPSIEINVINMKHINSGCARQQILMNTELNLLCIL